MTGSGEQFALRDPWGIRPAFYYYDDEILVVASERPVIQTALNVLVDQVHELLPGQAIFANQNNEIRVEQILEPKPNVS
jgi:amidophosphoribosyltransferase